jgi:hypothetical protein
VGFCRDLDLGSNFESQVANAITQQLEAFQRIQALHPLPSKETIVLLKLHLSIGNITLTDQVEWDVVNPTCTPEEFALTLCVDLGLPREFQVAIAHSCREQLLSLRQQGYPRHTPSATILRPVEELDRWTPCVERK